MDGTQVRRQGTGTAVVLHRLVLEVVEGVDRGERIELRGTHLRIGSDASNDLVLRDRMVSRQHAEIVAEGERYVLRDLGSTNGTFVGTTQVTEAMLDPGATLRLGDTTLAFTPKKKWKSIDAETTARFGALRGHAPVMREAMALLAAIAPTELTCLVLGETGTGKELAARGLHAESARHAGPFIVVDCGAVSSNLIESELFGHERGAFTGADRARIGAFEAARGGTLFLDEIGELPIDLQPKLLRALERREIKRVGSTQETSIDVRVVAATHRALGDLVTKEAFRRDLYYRLAEVVVTLPPLRERRDDIADIANHLAQQESQKLGRERVFGQDALAALSALPWNGNARELRNVVRRAVSLSTTSIIDRATLMRLSPDLAGATAAPPEGASSSLPRELLEGPLKESREAWNRHFERAYLEALMARAEGDLNRASALAEVHRKSLERLLREHGIKS